MKTSRRLLSAILSIVMIICAVPFSAGAEDTLITADGFEYTVDTKKGEVTITGYTGTDITLAIPAEIDGYPVVTIGAKAFREANIEILTIPENVRTIGAQAFFGLGALRTMYMPSTICAIGDHAFYGCFSLDTVFYGGSYIDYPWDNIWISQGNDDFTGANVTCNCSGVTDSGLGYRINDGFASIADYAGLEHNVIIPETIDNYTVKKVDDLAFFRSYNYSVVIPNSVEEIHPDAFFECRNLAIVYFVGNAAEWEPLAKSCTYNAIADAKVVFLGNGDIDDDGEVSPADCLLFKKLLSRIIDEDSIRTDRADLNGDGDINAKDQLLLRRKLAN